MFNSLKNDTVKILTTSIVFAYFLLFPFGQLLRFEFFFAEKTITFLAVDIVASFSLIFLFKLQKPEVSKYFFAFFAVCIFSLLLSTNYFSSIRVIIGSLYLIRLFIYFSFYILVWNLSKNNSVFKKRIFLIFVISVAFYALLGWIQYFFFFDLTYLKYTGWDDHLGRIVGTFLDPGFTGIILAIGFFSIFLKYLNEKKTIYICLCFFFLVSLLFTYSRASYLVYIIGLAIIYYFRRKIKPVILFLAIFLLSIPLLPRAKGEGVKLERTRSVIFRLENYQETIRIIKNDPLFGVGFNNICWARENKSSVNINSHACSGSDSSILFIFATTGVIGLLIFIQLSYRIFKNVLSNYYGTVLIISFVAIFIHSFFSNSMFYPWVMGTTAFLLGISTKE